MEQIQELETLLSNFKAQFQDNQKQDYKQVSSQIENIDLKILKLQKPNRRASRYYNYVLSSFCIEHVQCSDEELNNWRLNLRDCQNSFLEYQMIQERMKSEQSQIKNSSPDKIVNIYQKIQNLVKGLKKFNDSSIKESIDELQAFLSIPQNFDEFFAYKQAYDNQILNFGQLQKELLDLFKQFKGLFHIEMQEEEKLQLNKDFEKDIQSFIQIDEFLSELQEEILYQFYKQLPQEQSLVELKFFPKEIYENKSIFKKLLNKILLITSVDKYPLYFKSNKRKDEIQFFMRQFQIIIIAIKNKFENPSSEQGYFSSACDYSKMEKDEFSAKHFFDISNDLRKIILKRQPLMLKKLKLRDYEGKSNEDLQKMLQTNIDNSIYYYKQAKEFTKYINNIPLQIKYRNNIALCHYLKGNLIIAQLYAISSLYMIIKNQNDQYKNILIETQKVLQKIQNNKIQQENEVQNLNISQDFSLIPSNQLFSSNEIGRYKQQINKDYQLLLSQVGYNLTFYDESQTKQSQIDDLINYELIQESQQKMNKENEIKRKLLATTFSSLVYQIFPFLGTNLYDSTKSLIFQIQQFKQIKQEWNDFQNKQIIQKELSQKIKDCMELYKQKRYKDFILELSKKYHKDYIIYDYYSKNCNPQQVLAHLLEYGLRPDSIAYILYAIGQSLMNSDLKCPNEHQYYHIHTSIQFFKAVQSQQIKDKAQEIDQEKLKILHERMPQEQKYSLKERFIEYFLLKNERKNENVVVSSVAKVDLDKQIGALEQRVNELCEIANINILLAGLISQDSEQNIIQQLTQIIQNEKIFYIFFEDMEEKIEALKEIYFAITNKSFTDKKKEIINIEINQEVKILIALMDQGKYKECDQMISRFDETFIKSLDSLNSKEFYFQIANCYWKLYQGEIENKQKYKQLTSIYSSKYFTIPGLNQEKDRIIIAIKEVINK